MPAKKLLVADDSLTIQKVIRLALSGAAASSGDSYDIQAVSDGNDAVQQISLFRPDIVLIDVSLPGKSAFEVKRAINEHRDLDDVRFVLMSSAFERVDEQQVQEVEFHGRLTKPFDPAHLREVLSQVLSQIQERHREPTVLLRRGSPPPPPPESEPQREIEESPSSLPLEDDLRPASYSMPPRPSQMLQMPPLPPLQQPPQMPPQLETVPPDMPEEPALPPFTPDFQQDYPPAPPELPLEMPSEPPSAGPLGDFSANLPPSPPPAPDDVDADIRNLTESTIRMAGLDDFEWSVQEPSLKPPPSMGDTGRSNFALPPRMPEHKPRTESPTAPPKRSEERPEPIESGYVPLSTEQTEASRLDFGAPSALPSDRGQEIEFSPPSPIEFAPEPPLALAERQTQANEIEKSLEFEEFTPAEAETAHPHLSSEQLVEGELARQRIDEAIRREVDRVFQEVAQKVLPEVAERLIREEIRKLLNEQPGS